jgi:hypothetical protein
VVIDFDFQDIHQNLSKISYSIENYYNYKYLGINDLFVVSDYPKEGEFLGRITFYDVDTLEKTEPLLNDTYSYKLDTSNEYFNCALIYFCVFDNGERFAISVSTILNSLKDNLFTKIKYLASSSDFTEKIKNQSLDGIKKIDYVGIEDICDIDLKFGVFQTMYSDFITIEDMEDEIMSNEDIKDMLKDICRRAKW